MSRSTHDDIFWHLALEGLWFQYRKVHPRAKKTDFKSKLSQPRFIKIDDGAQLTIAKEVNGQYVPDEQYEPVKCYSRINHDEPFYKAVRRVMPLERQIISEFRERYS